MKRRNILFLVLALLLAVVLLAWVRSGPAPPSGVGVTEEPESATPEAAVTAEPSRKSTAPPPSAGSPPPTKSGPGPSPEDLGSRPQGRHHREAGRPSSTPGITPPWGHGRQAKEIVEELDKNPSTEKV